jgi:hypothetical protein
MDHLNDSLKKRGVTEEQMDAARRETQAYADTCNPREARKASDMMQGHLRFTDCRMHVAKI